MPESRTYAHLSPEERASIMLQVQSRRSLREMAHALGRSPSTLSRELKRAGCGAGERYDATAAAQASGERRQRSRRRHKLEAGTPLHQYVQDRLLYWHWSPQQIAAKLRAMPAEDCPGLVSHETIYATIYAHPRGALKQGLIQALRQAKATRGRRRTSAAGRASFVPEALRIAWMAAPPMTRWRGSPGR